MDQVYTKEPVKDWTGKVIGWIESDKKGNKRVRDFFGRVLGTYDAASNFTRDFYLRPISRGDTCIGLLYKK